MERQLKLLFDPIFGVIHVTERGVLIKKDMYPAKQLTKPNYLKRENFCNKRAINKCKEVKETKSKNTLGCLFCLQDDYDLDKCQQFAGNMHRKKKISFLKVREHALDV